MGQPSRLKACYMQSMGERRELKHLSSGRKRKQNSDSLSSGERTGKSPNHGVYGPSGVVGPRCGKKEVR